MSKYFFSVCIPVTDRERTIYNTLCSVALQTFRNYEVIIVESGSKDLSKEQISFFFESDVFAQHPFEYVYTNKVEAPKTVEDWNFPLQIASGKYIAMLEGDDQFKPRHLEEAYLYLTRHPNIGLYAVGNQVRQRGVRGMFNSDELTTLSVTMKDPAPPSEAIFIRLSKKGIPFMYNDIEYEYGPEADLYTRIGIDGYDGFHSDLCDVIRDINPKPWNIFHYYTDRFTILKKYEYLLDKDLFEKTWNWNLGFAIKGALRGFPSKTIKFCRQMIIKTSWYDFFKAFPLALIDIYNRKIKNARP